MKRNLDVLSFADVVAKLSEPPHPRRTPYMAMYSTWWGGIVRDPNLMLLPIDDHVVHRGDGVFEAVKCVDGKIYALDRHLERMARSAEMIALDLPAPLPEIREAAVETTRVAGAKDCLLRMYVSRGPGSFTPNPYESIGSQFYLVITPCKPVAPEKYETGVSVRISSYRVKESFFATVKSCNYLANVLMKKESVDAGVDFTVSRDEQDHLAEGATENFAVISKDGEFLVPGFERTLKGVTAFRMMELARKRVGKGLITGVRNAHLTLETVQAAREAMMLGTTLDILPVTRFEGRPVGTGAVGSVCREFLRLLRADMTSGPLVTKVP